MSVPRTHPTPLLTCPLAGRGQAVESLDYASYLTWSDDSGASWSEPITLFEDPVQPSSHGAKYSLLRDGTTLLAFVTRYNREGREEEGILSRETFGYTELDYLLTRSTDEGRTWSPLSEVTLPLEGAMEPCHHIVELQDGRWLYPTSTCKGWDGEWPNGFQAVAFVSESQGEAWESVLPIFDGTQVRIMSALLRTPPR